MNSLIIIEVSIHVPNIVSDPVFSTILQTILDRGMDMLAKDPYMFSRPVAHNLLGRQKCKQSLSSLFHTPFSPEEL